MTLALSCDQVCIDTRLYGDHNEISLNFFWRLLRHSKFEFTRKRQKLECQDSQIGAAQMSIMCGFNTFTISLMAYKRTIIRPRWISGSEDSAINIHIWEGPIIDIRKGLSNCHGSLTHC
jgi:hypothetical protein